jgi:hypothetical protein
VDHEQIGAAVPDFDRFVDEVVGLGGLLRDGVDSVLKDLAFSASHAGRLGGRHDAEEEEVAKTPKPAEGSPQPYCGEGGGGGGGKGPGGAGCATWALGGGPYGFDPLSPSIAQNTIRTIEPKGTSVRNHHPGFPVSCHRRVPTARYGMISARTATPMTIPNTTPATFTSASSHGWSPRAAEPTAINGTMGTRITR